MDQPAHYAFDEAVEPTLHKCINVEFPLTLHVPGPRFSGKTSKVVDLINTKRKQHHLFGSAALLFTSSMWDENTSKAYASLLKDINHRDGQIHVSAEMYLWSTLGKDVYDAMVARQERLVGHFGNNWGSQLLLIFDELSGARKNQYLTLLLKRAKELNISVIVVECVEEEEHDDTFSSLFSSLFDTVV